MLNSPTAVQLSARTPTSQPDQQAAPADNPSNPAALAKFEKGNAAPSKTEKSFSDVFQQGDESKGDSPNSQIVIASSKPTVDAPEPENDISTDSQSAVPKADENTSQELADFAFFAPQGAIIAPPDRVGQNQVTSMNVIHANPADMLANTSSQAKPDAILGSQHLVGTILANPSPNTPPGLVANNADPVPPVTAPPFSSAALPSVLAPLAKTQNNGFAIQQATDPALPKTGPASDLAMAELHRSTAQPVAPTDALATKASAPLVANLIPASPAAHRDSFRGRRAELAGPPSKATAHATPRPNQTSAAQSLNPDKNAALPLSILETAKTGASEDLHTNTEFLSDLKSELRTGATGPGTLRTDPMLQRPEIPRQIAAQLAEVAQRMAGRTVELALHPKELGNVRLSLTAAEGGMLVTIIAERSETLDLMRRNIDSLAQEFHEIGYSDINFSFGQQNSQGSGDSGDFGDTNGDIRPIQSDELADLPAQGSDQQPYQLTLAPSDGIDIRV